MEKWAIITGASSGLGRDFAFQLAQRGYSLLLVARTTSALEELCAQILLKYQVKAETLTLDLSLHESPLQLMQFVENKNRLIEVLINNAGVGYHGQFDHQDPARIDKMLCLNINTLTMLSHLFARKMAEQKSGGYILQVASIAAFLPMVGYAAYAASKSYVLNFSLALNYELKPQNISVTVLCPGPTATNFFNNSSHDNLPPMFKSILMQSDKVVATSLHALFQRKGLVIPGFMNKFLEFSTRFMPRTLFARLTAQFDKVRT